MTESDLEWFVGIRNQVSEMLHNPSTFSVYEARVWFPETDSKYWVIELNGQKMGYFRVLELNRDTVLIGADLDPRYQGKGYGYLSYLGFAREILLPQGIKEIELRVLKKNTRAINLYAKLGFMMRSETDKDYSMYNTVINLLRVTSG
jgi:RimJ/RimL family protein N-acetyltransferase